MYSPNSTTSVKSINWFYRLLLTGLAIAFILVFAIKGNAQSYVGGTVGVENSTNYFGETAQTFGAEAQKEWLTGNQQFRLRGRFQLNLNPRYPSLFQGDRIKQEGYEIRATPEFEYSPVKVLKLRPFVGVGVDYFHQTFPNEDGGKTSHFHTGLNPLGTAGVTFGTKTVHRVAASYIFQEIKAKRYHFTTREYDYYGNYVHETPVPGAYKGTFNPSYLDGWRADYSFVKQFDNSRFKLIGGVGAEVVEFTKCVYTGRGGFDAYCAAYYDRDVTIGARIGIAIGNRK
jgi:hypothetical protein